MPDLLPVPLQHRDAGRRLQSMSTRLAGIDQLTEQAFLRIGEQVRDGHRRAVVLTSLAERTLRLGEDASAEQTVTRLQLLIERSALWLTEAHDRSTIICAILATLAHDVEALSVPLRGLTKVVKTLQALRVATRIEAARSHGQGAQVLGQELHHLGTLMQEKLDHIAERCDVLATLRHRAMVMEEQAQVGPLLEADGEIRQARLLLGKVATHCVQTADHAVRTQQCSTELAGNFGELVAALQFQDITRQRLQHIRGALDGLGAVLLAEAGAKSATGDVCQLQHDQLALAVGEFCEAIERLGHNLRGMHNGVQSLADDTRAALFASSSEQCARIAPSLQAVTLCLEKVQTTHLAAGQAVFAVCQAVRDVADLTGEIERLGEEMQLLAQNAAVSAAHGSVRAAGLTVIAGNIQALAEDAGRYAAAMADGCRRVSGQAEELDARDQQSSDCESDLGALLEEARAKIGQLEGVSQSFDASIAVIGQQVAELGEEMQAALAGLDIRRQFLAHAEPVLEELRALAREHGAVERDVEDDHMLLSLRNRYTMMSEREIHHRFLRQHKESHAQDDRPLPVCSADDLGSNVELF
ncbi:MAG: hypothetical protein NDI73_02870 [Desulfuromonadales bacterium]|nr:hypothetical protein [Desulfuromonadales bacterium]